MAVQQPVSTIEVKLRFVGSMKPYVLASWPIIRSTEKAVLVSIGDEEHWLPRRKLSVLESIIHIQHLNRSELQDAITAYLERIRPLVTSGYNAHVPVYRVGHSRSGKAAKCRVTLARPRDYDYGERDIREVSIWIPETLMQKVGRRSYAPRKIAVEQIKKRHRALAAWHLPVGAWLGQARVQKVLIAASKVALRQVRAEEKRRLVAWKKEKEQEAARLRKRQRESDAIADLAAPAIAYARHKLRRLSAAQEAGLVPPYVRQWPVLQFGFDGILYNRERFKPLIKWAAKQKGYKAWRERWNEKRNKISSVQTAKSD